TAMECVSIQLLSARPMMLRDRNRHINGWDTHTEAETYSETRRGYTSKFKTCQSNLADHLRHKLKG
ncbi:hypothetical protein Tco_0937039, partial [Tanacetum coccineum]